MESFQTAPNAMRVLSDIEILAVSGGELAADGSIVVTAPTPTYNRDLDTYATMHNDGGYVTYDRNCSGFLGLWGCDFSVSGGGTYETNGGGWTTGTSGVDYTWPSTTYTPTAD